MLATQEFQLGDVFFRRIGAQAVGAWQVRQMDGLASVAVSAIVFFHSDTSVVSDMLASARERVEERGCSAVGVAGKRYLEARALLLQSGESDVWSVALGLSCTGAVASDCCGEVATSIACASCDRRAN